MALCFKGICFYGLRWLSSKIQLPSSTSLSYLSKIGGWDNNGGHHQFPACLPPWTVLQPTSGHGHHVSSSTGVTSHFKSTSNGTVSTAVTDSISAPCPPWPSVSVLLNFSILVITASSVTLKIYTVTKSLLSKQAEEKHIGRLIF